ncbi:hypothetical protein Tco_0378209 [Tanacetum coccineum]
MLITICILSCTDIKSDPEEAPSKIEEFQPLVTRAPITDGEFEVSEPSDTRITSSHSSASSDSTAPLSPDHPLTQASPTRVSFHRRTAHMAVRTQPTLSPGMSARIAEATALSPSSFHKRYISSYKTPSPSSLTLPIRKRYRGTSKLVKDTEEESSDSDAEREGSEDEGPGLEDEGPGSEDEGPGLDDKGHDLEDEGPGSEEEEEEEEATPEDPEDGEVYTNIPTYVPPAAPVQTSPSPEWSPGSLPVPPSSLVVPSPIASPVTPLATTISVDEDQFLEGYDRDLRELYARLREARDEFFSQRYRLRSLEREQERATVTFRALWRPVLALEAWVRRVDARMAEMSQARYDDHMLIHDMLVQQAMMQRELQEMRGCVTTLEQEMSRREH